MPADLDSLTTALYVLADDFLPARTGPGRWPRITDAELIALTVAQIFLGCHSERRFLRLARRRLGHLFPYIPQQPGYNKRIRALAPRICLVITQLARVSPSFCDRIRLLDSTPVPCGASRETVKRSDLAGWAAYGYCASHSRYFWGLRLYLCCAPDGMPVSFCLAPANEPEREVAAAMLENARRDGLLTGQEIIIGDKGFSGPRIRGDHRLSGRHVHPPRPQERASALRQPRRRPPMDRVDQRHAQGPTLPRRPGGHSPEGVWARVCRRPRPRRRRLAQLAALGNRPPRHPRPPLHRLRPLIH